MHSLVFFGKGGIGKSTTSANVSAVLAAMGMRVLHVGCDPKHDSTIALLGGRLLEPVIDKITHVTGVKPEDIVTRSHLGVDCVEAGGPAAGVGCGGRGVSRMLEIFNEANLLSDDRYDVAIYDVLGDVVCGGFAAPLRKGVGEKVVIVTSEEMMSIYAANNIASAIVHYQANGVALAGLVVNVRDGGDIGAVERYAAMINTKVLATIPREPLIREAEFRRMTVVEYAPGAPISRTFRALAETLLSIDKASLPSPTPLEEREFYAQASNRFESAPPPPAEQPRVEAATSSLESVGPPEPILAASRLLRGHAERTAATRLEFETELDAGRRVVSLGRLRADEALQRLRTAFPKESQGLSSEDFLT